MTFNKLTAVFIVLALILGAFTVNSYVTAQRKMQYEYLVQGKRELDRKEGEGLQGEFNSLGAEGWQLVGVLPGKADAYSVVFMRPKGK